MGKTRKRNGENILLRNEKTQIQFSQSLPVLLEEMFQDW
jgi:hypothetical protein